MNGVSPQFEQAILNAIDLLRQVPDDAVNYLMGGIPNTVSIYPLPAATPDQATAGGCPHCTYLGLWSDYWPGFQMGRHGAIWLFEDGISRMGEHQYRDLVDWKGRPLGVGQTNVDQLTANVYEVLLHEAGHALQRDHVLDELEKIKGQGAYAPARAAHDCGQCPGRSSF